MFNPHEDKNISANKKIKNYLSEKREKRDKLNQFKPNDLEDNLVRVNNTRLQDQLNSPEIEYYNKLEEAKQHQRRTEKLARMEQQKLKVIK